MNRTRIKWTERTWNPNSGCAEISEGCKFCYAKTLAERYRGTKTFPRGFDLTLRPHKLLEPLKATPSMIFVNSMSDLFWEELTDEWRDQVIDVIEQTPWHQYQVLTKRPEEMLRYSRRRRLPPNFWAGVSVEHQRWASRVDILREVKAETRFISAEPILGPLRLRLDGIQWLIAGGESGTHLFNPAIRERRGLVDYDGKRWTPRKSRVPWVGELRDQCTARGVAFFFKQWGGRTPESAGRRLDGRHWDQFPTFKLGGGPTGGWLR